jgi:glycosyltransferase involved in cell wall biosynthesis
MQNAGQKKRILVVSHATDNRDSGASRVVHLIKEAIACDARSVDLKHNKLDPAELRTKILGRLAMPQLISALVERPEDYDVIIGFNGTLYPLFERLKARSRRPALIEYVHGLNTFDRIAMLGEVGGGRHRLNWHYRLITGPLTGRLAEKWEWRGASLADVIVVQNSRDREFLQRKVTGDIRQVSLPLIPEIEAAAKHASPLGRDQKKVLWFGSWTLRKAAHFLPGAWALVLKQVPDAMLTIGGAGRSKDEILAQFPATAHSSIRVLNRISVRQQIEEYAANAVFLFPSLSEGFGFALLEAMAMGMAPVATLTGFAADHATPGKEIVAVPMANSERMAAAVIHLIQDDARRIEIATAAQVLARKFTLARYGQSLIQIIDAAEAIRSRKVFG